MWTFRRTSAFALSGLLAVCTTVAYSVGAAARAADAPPSSLSVRELNIVDENGQARLRIGAPLPDPKGLKRAVKAVGLQFMDPSGKEIGGLVMLDSIGVRGLCLDSEAGYEAMCMSLVKGEPSVTFRQDWKERITLGVEKGTASIVLSDAQGSPRVKLEVTKDGETRVQGVSPAR
jgi:hypothetical protein